MLCNLICTLALAVAAPWQKPAAEPASAPTSPGPRRAFGFSYDEPKQRMLLFGGASNPDVQVGLDATWSFSAAKWSALAAKGPSARRGCSSIFDAKRGQTILVGGGQGDDPTSPVFDDTWLFDGATWTKSPASVPGKRTHFAAAYDRKRECAVLVGGMNTENGKMLGDVLEWNGSEWKASAAVAPDGLFAPQLAFDEKAGLLVLISTKMPERKLATWTFDGATFAKLDENGPPVIASGQSLVTLGPRGGVMLFGGFGAEKPVADTWSWDGKTWKQLDAPGPSARVAHSMAYDRKRSRVVLFGGEDGTKVLGDVWEFDGRAWKESKQ